MPQKRSQKRGENVQDMACQVLFLSNLKYIKVTKNSQSLGNLEVIGVQKTACFAHMTSRSYNPEFNNPLEKVVDTFQRYNTVDVSMHKIGHFTPNILAYSRIPAAYSTLLFTGCVCVASFRGKCQCYNYSFQKRSISLSPQTEKISTLQGGERQNVLRCLGGCGSKFVQGVTLCKKPTRDLSSKMFVNLI